MVTLQPTSTKRGVQPSRRGNGRVVGKDAFDADEVGVGVETRDHLRQGTRGGRVAGWWWSIEASNGGHKTTFSRLCYVLLLVCFMSISGNAQTLSESADLPRCCPDSQSTIVFFLDVVVKTMTQIQASALVGSRSRAH